MEAHLLLPKAGSHHYIDVLRRKAEAGITSAFTYIHKYAHTHTTTCVYPCAEITPPHMSIYRYTAISHNTLLPWHSPPFTHYRIHATIPSLLIQASSTALAFSMEKESTAYQHHIWIESLRTQIVLRFSPLPKQKKCTF